MAGIITSFLACFPVFFMKLLDYVAIYGLILMPIGAVVIVEHWLLPWIGIRPYRAERQRLTINFNVLIVWIGTLVVCALLPVHLFFKWLPGYFIAFAAYTALEYGASKRDVTARPVGGSA
jgi:hypothetical protein